MRLLIAFAAAWLLGGTLVSAGAPTDDAVAAELGAGNVARAEALTLELIALEEKDPARSRAAVATHLETLAGSFYSTGTAEGADATERLFAKALALRESEPGRDEADLGSLLHALSGLHFNRGELDAARADERKALDIYQRIFPKGDLRTAESRRDLALIYLAEGRLSEAAPLLTEAVQAIEAAAPADWSVVALGRNYLAELYRVQGRQEEAAAVLERLVRDAKEKLGEDDPQYPYFLNNLAGIYRDQERYDESETLLRQSLALRRKAEPPDDGAVARATLNLAELFRVQGKYAESEPLYLEALALAKKSAGEGSTELLEFINQLAVLYRDQGKLDAAEPRFREAQALAERGLGPNHPRVAQSRFDLAELLRARGRCAEAEPDYALALEIRRSVLGPTHPDVAEVLAARAHCRTSGVKDTKAALADLDRALAILEDSESYPSIKVDALALRAELLRATDPARARKELNRAIDAVEKNRPHRGGGEGVRATFFGRYRAVYERMVRWDVDEGRFDEALLMAERGRARVLLDQLESARVGRTGPMDAELTARLAAARADVAESRQRLEFEQSRTDVSAQKRIEGIRNLEQRLNDTERKLRELWDESRNADGAWRRAVEPKPATIGALQTRVVPQAGLLLFYAIGAGESWLFVLSPAPGKVEALPLRIAAPDGEVLGVAPGALTEKTLSGILTGSRGLLTAMASPSGSPSRGIGGLTSSGEGDAAKLSALFRTLVPAALWPRLVKARQVLVIPDGPLLLMPFEALVVDPRPELSSSRFWLDDGPVIRYAPSATFIEQLNARAGGRPPEGGTRPAALSVSDPEFGANSRNLPRLPGTARESAAVRAALGETEDVVVIHGAAAREPAVRAALSGKRYVHLATHGFIDRDGENLFAALALTPPPRGTPPAGDDDGFLELFEIYALPLDCELAVLSACGSNAGTVVSGEGVFALSRGFLVGGARRVIASQWPVDDASTAELVGDLFRRIAAADRDGDPFDAARALRDAKLGIRRHASWANPFFWAPFVLTGVE